MKKDDSSRILKSNLSTLLKRFSSTDVITTLEKEYSESISGQIKLSLIDDNHVLKRAKVKKSKILGAMESLKEKGFATPLLIVHSDDRYEIVISREFYKAAKRLKYDTVPCSILNISEEEMLLFLATRNRDDKSSSVIEMSLLLNKLVKKYRYSQKDIALIIHQSRSQITNIIRLIKMPNFVLDDITDGKLSFGHARALAKLDENEMSKMLDKIYKHNLSVRDVERLVYESRHPNILSKCEKTLSKKYRANLSIINKKVTFSFANKKDRNKFLSSLGVDIEKDD